MGVNISLIKPGPPREYHPEWDEARFSGDREILERIDKACGLITWPEPFEPWRDGDPLYRPARPEALDQVEWAEWNPDRWALLTRILRDEPEYWIDYGI